MVQRPETPIRLTKRAMVIMTTALFALTACSGGTGLLSPSAGPTGASQPSASVAASLTPASARSSAPASATAQAIPSPHCTTPLPTAAAGQPVEQAAPGGTIQATIKAPGSPAFALVEDGSVWVSAHRGTIVDRIDPAKGTIVAMVELDPSHQHDSSGPLNPGIGGPWAYSFAVDGGPGSFIHIDAATNATRPDPLAAKLSILGGGPFAVTTDGLWATTTDAAGIALVKLDQSTGAEMRRTVIASPARRGFLLAAFGSIWFTGDTDLTVEQADPGTGVITNAVAVPATPVGIAASEKALYVAGSNASVARLDPTTGCVTASIVLGGLGTDPIAVAATSTAVYVGYDSGAIAVLDPTTLAVRHAYRLDTQDDQGGLAFANGSVWYPTFGSNTILRVKP
jgi:streptogramin lyase